MFKQIFSTAALVLLSACSPQPGEKDMADKHLPMKKDECSPQELRTALAGEITTLLDYYDKKGGCSS